MPEILPDSSKKLLQYVIDGIHIDEPKTEINSLAYRVVESLFHIDKTEVMVDRSINITSREKKAMDQFIARINNNEPLQYIVGETEFYGRKFEVNSSVMIPRPETEELVALIIKENRDKKIRFLDIGTGSGCIPVTLLRELKDAKASAIDFDPRVIKTARSNTARYEVEIEFLLIDILTEPIPGGPFDLIVSNPPYVRESEKEHMKPNVLDHEPPTALFVSDNDPMLFYRRICELSQQALKEGGRLYFEVNEYYAEDIKAMMEVMEYHSVDIVKDLNGKNRIVRGLWTDDIFAKPEGI